MSLKDEIQQLLTTYSTEVAAKRDNMKTHREAQELRFRPWKPLLKELEASVPKEHFRLKLEETYAEIKVGRDIHSRSDHDLEINIDPASFMRVDRDTLIPEYTEQPGYTLRLSEHCWQNYPDLKIQNSENIAELMETIVHAVCKAIARYR